MHIKKSGEKRAMSPPLLYFTKNQSNKLSKRIGSETVLVDFAMRYGNPSIKSKLNKLKTMDAKTLLFFLYILNMPQQQPQQFAMRYIDH